MEGKCRKGTVREELYEENEQGIDAVLRQWAMIRPKPIER